MGKRSTFKRRPQDAYDTPYKAILPLLEHLDPCEFVEPCAGNGLLIGHLERHGFSCVGAFDTHPRDGRVSLGDATRLRQTEHVNITNPPWTRAILHPIIHNLAAGAPTWLLFDADWAHTVQAIPYMPYCRKIVSVGRLKWIEDSAHTGKDNVAWYLFDHCAAPRPPQFFPRSQTTCARARGAT
jgi:hypothetical protein